MINRMIIIVFLVTVFIILTVIIVILKSSKIALRLIEVVVSAATVTDRTSAPWMTLEIKQAKVQRRLAERKWRESGLSVHREIYVKQHSLVSNMISKAKKDYLCHKIVNCGSSRELFRLSSQMTGKFGDAIFPANISPESLPDKFNEVFVQKTEEIRSSFDPGRPIPTKPVEFSGTVFAEFQLVTEDFVKTVVQEMPQKSCDLDPYPPLSFMIVWMKLFP